MNKKTTILLAALGLMVCTIITGVFVNSALRSRMRETMIDQYAQQELAVATATARAFERDVANVTEQLKLLALIPEIRSGDTAACTAALQKVVRDLSVPVGNIGRIDGTGVFRCSVNKALVGVRGDKLGPYITQIFSDPEHKTVMSRMIIPPGANSYVVAVHVPVFNADGKFDGTLGGAIYLNDFKEKYLGNIKFANDGYATLRDDNGDILYHPRKEFIGMNNRTEAFAKLTNRKGPAVDTDSLPSGTVRYVFEGREKVAAYVHAQVLPGRYWVVNVNVPIEDIETTVLQPSVGTVFPLISMLIIAASALPCLFLLLYLSITIFRPLKTMQTFVERLESGDLDVQVPITGKDEIGSLGTAFNSMARSLSKLTGNLEKMVLEKTAELSKSVESLKMANKATEAQALEARKFQQAVESATECISITGLDLRYIYVNPAWERITMRKKGDVLGKTMEEIGLLTAEVDPEHHAEMMQAAAEGKAYFSDTLTHRRPDGTTYPGEIHAYPIIVDGKVQFNVRIHTDITDRVRTEKAKSEFISLASHQLRTPLTAIRWIIGTLQGGKTGPLTDIQKDMISDAQKASLHMAETIGTMLTISRIEASKIHLEIGDVVADALLRDIVSEQQTVADGKKQDLMLNAPAGILIQTDKKVLTEILANLVSNAVKYTPDKGKITVDLEQKGETAVFRVADNGYGIPKADQARIFCKFFRAENVVSKQTEGTGLGLYLVHSLVEMLGGTIEFTSEENKGTTFIVTIPLHLPSHA